MPQNMRANYSETTPLHLQKESPSSATTNYVTIDHEVQKQRGGVTSSGKTSPSLFDRLSPQQGQQEAEEEEVAQSFIVETNQHRQDGASTESGEEEPKEELEDAMVHDAHDSAPAWKPAIFTTLPVFMGYAGMVVLQAHIKERLGIADGANNASYLFGLGVSFIYLGNLVFRLMHNVLFSCLRPRQRVMVAYSALCFAHLLLASVYYIFNSKSVAWVFVAYTIAGIGIGTFESNVMSCLTPMGHQTKMWANFGIPLGFNSISIGSFVLFAIFPKNIQLQLGVYLFISASNLAGLVFYALRVPNIHFEASDDTAKVFFKDLCRIKEWFPIMWKHCGALSLDMFTVSAFSSIAMYIYDVPETPLWWNADVTVPKNAFLAVYFVMSFLGDFVARRVAYYSKARNPFLFIILSAVGIGMILSKLALVAPLGMFCVMFANGSVYAHTTRFVDNCVPRKYNLVALSVWLFLGDVGSFIGAQTVQTLRGVVGDVPHAGIPADNSRQHHRQSHAPVGAM